MIVSANSSPRKTVQTILFSLMLIAIMTFTPSGLVSAATASLHSSGIYLYNSSGQRVNLYGLNIMYGQGESVTPTDLQTAKSLGFNAFRVNTVYWGLIQPYNQSINGIDVPFFSTGISTPLRGVHPNMMPLDTMVSLAVQQNMYVIICLMAWTGWYVPPQWAFPSVSHAGNNAVWGGQSSATLQGYAGIISESASKERTGIINTWKFIASRYSGIPNVMFELLNEPAVSNTSLAGAAYKSFNEDIISAIESVEGQSHLKLVEFLRDGTDLEIVQGSMDLSKSNVAWASHQYAPADPYNPNGSYYHDTFTWHGQHFPAATGNGTTYLAWRIIRVAVQAHGWGRPWMVTEFSKQVTKPNYIPWFKTVMATMNEQYAAAWYYYCYSSVSSNDAGWNIDDLATRKLIMPLLSPYMTSGTTTSTTSSSVTSISSTLSSMTTSTLTTSTSVQSTSVTTTTGSVTSTTPLTTTSTSTSHSTSATSTSAATTMPTTSTTMSISTSPTSSAITSTMTSSTSSTMPSTTSASSTSATSSSTTSSTLTTSSTTTPTSSTSSIVSSTTSTTSSTSTSTTSIQNTPSTIASIGIATGTQMPNQRKSCFSDGLFWLFAPNGTYFNAYSSADGKLWKTQMIRGSSGNPGEVQAVWCGPSNTFAYAFCAGAGGSLLYRKGTLNADGTITWATSSEQTAVAGATGVNYNDFNVVFDSSNEPWIGYYLNYASNSSRYASVVMCTSTDGSWSSACVPTPFPYRLSSVNSGGSRFMVTLVPLTSGKMMIEYVPGTDMMFRDRVYYANNKTLGGEEAPTGMTLGSVYGYSSVAQGDDVYTVINSATSFDLAVYKRTYATGVWGRVVTIQPSTSSTTDPVMSIDESTGNLYVFWAGSPSPNHIYYRKFQASNSTWVGPVDWITEASLNGNDKLTSYYQASNNYIGLAYVDNTSNPYQIRFIYLLTTKQ